MSALDRFIAYQAENVDHADEDAELEWECLIAELQDERDRLRELVRAAWKCIHSGLSCSDCRLIAGGCTLQTAMRELGIEVGA